MPLIAFLQEGLPKEAGWHRNAERRARGMFPTPSLTSQLEPWERQLVSLKRKVALNFFDLSLILNLSTFSRRWWRYSY
jgi:hypothetical protein